MMMRENFVHFQAVPRYSNKVNKYGINWDDIDYPNRPSFKKLEIDAEILKKISEDML